MLGRALFAGSETTELQDALNNKNSLLKALTGDASTWRLGDNTDSTVLAHDHGRQVQVVDTVTKGTFGNIQPGFQPGGRVGIFSAVVDFVF